MANPVLRTLGIVSIVSFTVLAITWKAEGEAGDRPSIAIRGIYGGVPREILDRGKSLDDFGVNAVWVGSGGLTAEDITLLKTQGARVFAEFNTMHEAGYLKDHPDAMPVGTDGKPCPAPDGWQGVCPTHPGYRESRMEAFRKTQFGSPLIE